MEFVNLDHIILPLPTEYDGSGNPTGFYDRSLSDIIADQDPYEIQLLKDWVADEIYAFLGWTDKDITLEPEHIQRVLTMFYNLGHQPCKCKFDPSSGKDADDYNESI